MIDQADLHLCSKWDNTGIENIATTFPKVIYTNCTTLVSILHQTVFLTFDLNT